MKKNASNKLLFFGRMIVAWSALLQIYAFGIAPTSATEGPKTEADQRVKSVAMSSEAVEFFEKKIRPLFAQRCYECHSIEHQKAKGGLTLDTREGVFKGGDSGAVLVSGQPDASLLIEAVRYKKQELLMPPKNPLSALERSDLERWVQMGALYPVTATGVASSSPLAKVQAMSVEEGRRFWSFKTVVDTTSKRFPPSDGATDGFQHEQVAASRVLDALVNESLAIQGLQPAGAADKGTLLRRATFDLTGLPPSPEDLSMFLADNSPDSFARVVERLLASPAYGERWGRHWLDVARYADSNGLDENVAFGNAWRYRDYVIRAFNSDKPFDQFVQEQIAGDLLPFKDEASRYERLTALGFLCLGPKLLAEPDKQKLEMDLIDEQIDTLGRAFLGLTLGCARCHAHKFDPVPTEDYYALAAIFKSTRTMDDFKTVAKWHEPSLASSADKARWDEHQRKINAQKARVSDMIAEANELLLSETGMVQLPSKPEGQYPPETIAALKAARDVLAKLEKESPELPSTMGVSEQSAVMESLPVHIRGNYLTLGQPVPRGVLQVLIPEGGRPLMPDKQSGRLELARWIASPANPLTARVMVNRIWRWHFGQGLVASTDNFGVLGERPSHPELLDWLASRFVEQGWSIKALHRILLNSAVYQRAARPVNAGLQQRIDPNNRLLSFFSPRRLEAEEIRDALHAVTGSLDRTMGGKTLPLKNREFVFNHTSKDATTYESARRAVYLPVIRNNVYDLFEQFDFPDPAVSCSSRASTVVAPQALLVMNADIVTKAAERFSVLLQERSGDVEAKIDEAYVRAFARLPSTIERQRALRFLTSPSKSVGAPLSSEVWKAFCQVLLASNEFIYLN